MATDPKLEKPQKDHLPHLLVAYFAEISRAHNNSIEDSDNPSCYPGTITRLDRIFQGHPDFTVQHNVFEVTPQLASQLVVKAFYNELKTLSENDRQDLFEALTLYSDDHAINIINYPEKLINFDGDPYSPIELEKFLLTRKQFFEKYFGADGKKGVAQINQQLIEKYELHLDEETEIIAHAALMNMGRATLHTTHSLTDAFLCSRQKQTPKNAPMDLEPANNANHVLVQFGNKRRRNELDSLGSVPAIDAAEMSGYAMRKRTRK